jgi:hypothetical protein
MKPESEFRIGQQAIRAEMHALCQRAPFLRRLISLPALTFVSDSTPYTPGSIPLCRIETAQVKASKPQHLLDEAKHRFHRGLAFGIRRFAFGGF